MNTGKETLHEHFAGHASIDTDPGPNKIVVSCKGSKSNVSKTRTIDNEQ